MQLIADGKAPRIPQTEEGASYEGIQKKSNAKVSPSLYSEHIHGSVVESNGEQIHLEPELQEGPGPGYKRHSPAVKHQIGGPALTPSRVWSKSREAQGPSCCSSRLRCPLRDDWSLPKFNRSRSKGRSRPRIRAQLDSLILDVCPVRFSFSHHSSGEMPPSLVRTLCWLRLQEYVLPGSSAATDPSDPCHRFLLNTYSYSKASCNSALSISGRFPGNRSPRKWEGGRFPFSLGATCSAVRLNLLFLFQRVPFPRVGRLTSQKCVSQPPKLKASMLMCYSAG